MTDHPKTPTPGTPEYYADADPEFTVAAWRAEVAADRTRMGYHSWALTNRELSDDVLPRLPKGGEL